MAWWDDPAFEDRNDRKGIPSWKTVSLLCKLIQFWMIALSVTVHKALILLDFFNHPYRSLVFIRVSGIFFLEGALLACLLCE